MRTCACGAPLDTEEERGSGICDLCYRKNLKKLGPDQDSGATMSASLVQVIVTDEGRRGLGMDNSPVRSITRYFSPDGLLLAEVDVWLQQQVAELRRLALEANGKGDQATLAAIGMRLARLDALPSGLGHVG